MELLAPAGSFEALKTAVSAGADAVYFGGQTLNARVFGKNFTDEEIERAAQYCRRFGVKSYLTLNTLVSDKEKTELLDFLRHINQVPIDGVIVQDLGLARMMRRITPDLPVHASTQMTLHSLDGVRAAARLGFSRAVLSRELPKSELAYICKNSPIEIEAFIHGALCMCYSGQCYLSSVIGERSGNRGKCAQPCRKAYGKGYELSLKDLCMANYFTSFTETGVHSLKIEGRMKSPDYVAGVVGVYRRLIDEKRNATEAEMRYLSNLFSREGFTNGYFSEQIGKSMFGVRTAENKEKSRETVANDLPPRKIKIKAIFAARKGLPMRLTLTDGVHCVSAEGEVPQTAEKIAATAESCAKQLQKTGATDFETEQTDCTVENGLFISVRALNDLRRTCTRLLEEALSCAENRRFLREEANLLAPVPQKNRRIAYCRTAEQALAVGSLADEIWVPLHTVQKNYFNKTAAVLPPIVWDREKESVLKQLAQAKERGITKVICQGIGQIAFCRQIGFAVGGFAGFNIFNSEALQAVCDLGLSSATLSFELNGGQIRDIRKMLPVQTVVYGRYPVMLTENCILKNKNACVHFKGFGSLRDETGRTFPVFCEPPHRNMIYNAVPLYMGDKPRDLPQTEYLFLFTTETANAVRQVLTQYQKQEPMTGNFTRGFFHKKV